jgi:thioredoxin-related protein
MEKSVPRTTRWFAFAVFLSPPAFCCAEPPIPSVEVSSAVVSVSESAVAGQQAASAVVEVQNIPLFKHANYPAAWTAAQESNRPILVYVSMPQCPHCTKMLEQTYESNGVNEIVKGSFETLQVSRYSHAALISKLHVRWYPTTVLVGSNNKVLDMIEGYVDANTFKQRLQLGIASANSDTQTR